MTEIGSILLITSAVSLTGLQLCVPIFRSNDDWGQKCERNYIELGWTHSLILRVFHRLSNIIGAIFVLGAAGYLTFTDAWWWLLIYVVGLGVANGVAYIFRILLIPICKDDALFRAKVHRITGCLLIWLGIILFFVLF